MKLTAWIQQVGARKAAELCGVSQRTARAWRQGVRFPTSSQASRLPAITEDRVRTLEDVFPRDLFDREEKAA